MKVMFKWEPEVGFFIIPTIFVKNWPRVIGITFLWLKFQLCFEFKKTNK